MMTILQLKHKISRKASNFIHSLPRILWARLLESEPNAQWSNLAAQSLNRISWWGAILYTVFTRSMHHMAHFFKPFPDGGFISRAVLFGGWFYSSEGLLSLAVYANDINPLERYRIRITFWWPWHVQKDTKVSLTISKYGMTRER